MPAEYGGVMYYVAAANTYVTNTATIWANWFQTGTNNATTILNDPWNGWVATLPVNTAATAITFEYEETEEARQARLERQREQQERARQAEAETQVARAHAEGLLLEHLDEEQRADWCEFHRFTVVAGGHRYQLSMVNPPTRLTRDGRRAVTYCIHFPHSHGDVPRADLLLAHKLAMEADIEAWLRTANATVYIREDEPVLAVAA